MKTTNKSFKIPTIAIILIIIGIFLLAIFFKNTSILASKKNNYIETEAIVIKHEYKNEKITAAIIEYTVGDNIYKTSTKSNKDKLKPYNHTVKLKYNPNNPKDIVYEDEKASILFPVGGITTFSIGLAIVIVTFIKAYKESNKNIIIEEAPVYNPVITEEISLNNDNNDIIINANQTTNNLDIINDDQTINDINNEIENQIISIPYISDNPTYNNETTVINDYNYSVNNDNNIISNSTETNEETKIISSTEIIRNKMNRLKEENSMNNSNKFDIPNFISNNNN